jgi:undecaprenyl diphosphate synthase
MPRDSLNSNLKGHWIGGQTLVNFVEWCMADGIEILTVYAFSTENWKRDAHEVNTLMLIISKYAESFKNEALLKNIKVKVLSTGSQYIFSSFMRLTLNRF